MTLVLLFLNLVTLNILAQSDPHPDLHLMTTAEKTDWQRTGRFKEVMQLCKAFQKEFPKHVRCKNFGETPEGRMMPYLIVSDGIFDPKKIQKLQRPVIYFQGGIHSGEIDGKDAGFWFLRQVLKGQILKGALAKMSFVFVPVFNIDGHERFGKNNRPNQIGPIEMGWRTTAWNLNLNRDFTKAESPEMQALLGLLNQWDPLILFDLHVTDGAQFQHDVAVMIAPSLKGPEGLRKVGAELSGRTMLELEKLGHLPVPFYPSFIKDDMPESGFEVGIAPPRYSQTYWASRNRIGILVETHSWKDYRTRVKATRDTLEVVSQAVMSEGAHWLSVAYSADREAKDLGGKAFALSYDVNKNFKQIDFKGYEFKREDSKVSGAKKISYFPDKPEIWKVSFFNELEPKLTVQAPVAGYWVPKALRSLIESKLKIHGIEYRVLKRSCLACPAEIFKAKEFKFGKTSYEGRLSLEVQGQWSLDKADLAVGSLFIPIKQRLARLILHLFEPKSVDSFLSWGFFNSYFEQKEYIENYVVEPIAEEMLQRNSGIKAEFEELLKDEAFRKDPERRLDFFYRRLPFWDSQFGIYPILKLAIDLNN